MGEDELAKGEVTLKDLYLGAEAAKAIESNEEWKSSRPAQETAPRPRNRLARRICGGCKSDARLKCDVLSEAVIRGFHSEQYPYLPIARLRNFRRDIKCEILFQM